MTPQEAISEVLAFAESYNRLGLGVNEAIFRDVASLIESLASAAVTVLPIESAPKDGTTFLAFRPKRGWMQTQWDMQPYNKKPVPYFHSYQLGTTDSRAYPATHWCILPAPTEPNP